MTTHRVTLIPGDGTGPELTEATRRVLEAAAATSGSTFDWDVQQAGVDVMESAGTPLPPETLESIKQTKVAIKGPITTPDRHRVPLGQRGAARRARALRLPAPVQDLPGRPHAASTRSTWSSSGRTPRTCTPASSTSTTPTRPTGPSSSSTGCRRSRSAPHSGISIKPISEEGSARIIRYAFQYAKDNGRQRVHCIQKSNIMKFTDGLFLSTFREVAKEFPDIEPWENLVDATCMGLVQRPEEWDVLVLPNLYGDILSDLTAGMVGGLGVAPGANIGTDTAVFEATHGSAPKYKGQNKVNPTAMILSGKLMLDHLGEAEAAQRLEDAVAAVIAEGKSVTYDMKPTRTDPTAVGTSQYADAIIEKLEASK